MFTVLGETGQHARIDCHNGPAIHAHDVGFTRHHEHQTDTPIAHDIAQAVDSVFALAVGQQQGLCIRDPHQWPGSNCSDFNPAPRL